MVSSFVRSDTVPKMSRRQQKPSKPPMESATISLSARRKRLVLCGILVVAAALRLVALGYAPPGLNQD